MELTIRLDVGQANDHVVRHEGTLPNWIRNSDGSRRSRIERSNSREASEHGPWAAEERHPDTLFGELRAFAGQ
jgi:hypothetical protein